MGKRRKMAKLLGFTIAAVLAMSTLKAEARPHLVGYALSPGAIHNADGHHDHDHTHNQLGNGAHNEDGHHHHDHDHDHESHNEDGHHHQKLPEDHNADGHHDHQ